MKINKDDCIGCGACTNVCPDGIEIKKNKAIIKDNSVNCLKEAAKICPVNAIK